MTNSLTLYCCIQHNRLNSNSSIRYGSTVSHSTLRNSIVVPHLDWGIHKFSFISLIVFAFIHLSPNYWTLWTIRLMQLNTSVRREREQCPLPFIPVTRVQIVRWVLHPVLLSLFQVLSGMTFVAMAWINELLYQYKLLWNFCCVVVKCWHVKVFVQSNIADELWSVSYSPENFL